MQIQGSSYCEQRFLSSCQHLNIGWNHRREAPANSAAQAVARFSL